MSPNDLRDRYRHDRPIDRAIIMQAADEIERLRAVLESIAETGGEVERVQAAEALEETK
jgi:hypothetical protein